MWLYGEGNQYGSYLVPQRTIAHELLEKLEGAWASICCLLQGFIYSYTYAKVYYLDIENVEAFNSRWKMCSLIDIART